MRFAAGARHGTIGDARDSLGPPGAGKGTQAKLMQQRLGCPHISTRRPAARAPWRAAASSASARSGYMDRGELVPTTLVIGMIEIESLGSDSERGLHPRRLPAHRARRREALDDDARAAQHVRSTTSSASRCRATSSFAGSAGGAPAGVRRDVPRRASIRRTPRASATAAAASSIQRDDDREETIGRASTSTSAQTAPLCDYYRTRGLLREVDATATGQSSTDHVVRARAPGGAA